LHCLSTVFWFPFCLVCNKMAVDRQCKKVIRRRWTENAKR
jgi:hypothetical protein